MSTRAGAAVDERAYWHDGYLDEAALEEDVALQTMQRLLAERQARLEAERLAAERQAGG